MGLEAETLRKAEERLIMEYGVVEGGLVMFESIQGGGLSEEKVYPVRRSICTAEDCRGPSGGPFPQRPRLSALRIAGNYVGT